MTAFPPSSSPRPRRALSLLSCARVRWGTGLAPGTGACAWRKPPCFMASTRARLYGPPVPQHFGCWGTPCLGACCSGFSLRSSSGWGGRHLIPGFPAKRRLPFALSLHLFRRCLSSRSVAIFSARPLWDGPWGCVLRRVLPIMLRASTHFPIPMPRASTHLPRPLPPFVSRHRCLRLPP